MRLVFEPFNNDKGLIRIMKEVARHPEISPVIDSILTEQDFTLEYLNVVNALHPGIDLFVNSFIQDSTVLKLNNVPVFVVAYDYDKKYETGGRYLSLNKTLIKNSYKYVQVVDNNSIFEEPDDGVIHDLLVELIVLWKEYHMGEITDAISKALKELDSVKPEEAHSVEDTTDKIKEVMRNVGMKVEDATKSTVVESKPVPQPEIEEPTIKEEPVEQDLQDDTPEICCKIADGKMAIMIPKGTKLDSRKVGDLEFDVLTFDMPDVNCNALQLLKTVLQDSDTKPTETKKPSVKKVAKVDAEEKPIQTNKKELQKSDSVDSESDLKEQKKEIDRLIKEARKSGDADKVNELRKQRRKLRAKMNKIGAE